MEGWWNGWERMRLAAFCVVFLSWESSGIIQAWVINTRAFSSVHKQIPSGATAKTENRNLSPNHASSVVIFGDSLVLLY